MSEDIRNMLDNIIVDKKETPKKLVSRFSEILLECASHSGLKTSQKRTREKNKSPWFDRECASLKNNVKALAKKLQINPYNQKIREELYIDKRKLQRMVKNKKTGYKTTLMERMHTTDPKQMKTFWKLLDKISLSDAKRPAQGNIKVEDWVDHFKNICHASSERPNLPENPNVHGPLDHEITMEEMTSASYILKGGKSPGPDNITNEMIGCALKHYPHVILYIFNNILKCGGDIPSWSVALLVPIFKKGDIDDPGNYRGISLLSCLAKFFYSILNKRLLEYVIRNNILKPNQLGFLPGNRTSDAHIILYNLINKYCHKKSTKIFGCFVDFSKAFDCIPRDILVTKLISCGITGKFLDVIKNIYKNVTSCIKIDGKLSPEFDSQTGVRQGCIMSPLLFNIFMSDLPDFLNQEDNVSLNNDLNINCLIWADDILILSKTESGLKSSLGKLDDYCKTNDLTVNIDKTKCMIFNKTGRLIRKDFFMGKNKIEIVRSYKYLGLVFTPSGEIKSALDDLRSRALKAYMGLKQKLGICFRSYLEETKKIFDSLVKPILLYSSDFWGCLKLPVNNPVENLYSMFCKQLLGVQKQTSNVGAFLEAGMVPLRLYAQKACIKNWERIHNSRANHFMRESYNGAVNDDLDWYKLIKMHLNQNGLGSHLMEGGTPPDQTLHHKYFSRVKDVFHQSSLASIINPNGKLRTYGLIKESINIENHLIMVPNIKQRTCLTRFRLSNHKLLVEVGRHQGLLLNERICRFCPSNDIEDEIHFLINCNTYQILRKPLLDICRELKPNFEFYSATEKFIFIMTCTYLSKNLAKFVYEAMELRIDLAEKN